MTKNSKLLYLVSLVCLGLLVCGYFLQHQIGLKPCPLCIIQRYLFIAIASFAFLAAISRKDGIGYKTCLIISTASGFAGVGVAGRQLWIQAYPFFDCGIDPMETILNRFITAKYFPSYFYADGLCSEHSFQLLGFGVAQWAFIWFAIFSIISTTLLMKTFKLIAKRS